MKISNEHNSEGKSAFSGNPLQEVIAQEERVADIVRIAEEEAKKNENDARDAARSKISEQEIFLTKRMAEDLEKEKVAARDFFERARVDTDALVSKIVTISAEKKKEAVSIVLQELKNSFSS